MESKSKTRHTSKESVSPEDKSASSTNSMLSVDTSPATSGTRASATMASLSAAGLANHMPLFTNDYSNLAVLERTAALSQLYSYMDLIGLKNTISTDHLSNNLGLLSYTNRPTHLQMQPTRKRKRSTLKRDSQTVTLRRTSSCDTSKSEDKAQVTEQKDDSAYWDRRKKNNEAAKRSRDARKRKEAEIASRAVQLENENLQLRAQISLLRKESASLHMLLYNRVNAMAKRQTLPNYQSPDSSN